MESNYPLLTQSLPGIGGRIKVEPEDFDVEEIPAYEPSGTGPHLYLWIEKRNISAEFFIRQLSKRLDIRPGDIGTAGMKDRRAVTRQWVSVSEQCEARLAQVDGDGISILRTSRHQNKLRPGHLKGNRFRVLVRDAASDALERTNPIVELIRRMGLPNYYGEQRFGRDSETLELGWRILRGQANAKRNPFLKKLALSSVQSLLFNNYLAQRMNDGLMRTVLHGDVLAKWPIGGMFVSTDPPIDQKRLENCEVIPAGPMFGKKMFPAAEVAAARETSILEEHGLTIESFRGFGSLLDGTRRHNFVYVDDLTCENEPAGERLSFTLPAGSYATVLLREVMKNQST
jgi:tRNA pseudouridine13 synthase